MLLNCLNFGLGDILGLLSQLLQQVGLVLRVPIALHLLALGALRSLNHARLALDIIATLSEQLLHLRLLLEWFSLVFQLLPLDGDDWLVCFLNQIEACGLLYWLGLNEDIEWFRYVRQKCFTIGLFILNLLFGLLWLRQFEFLVSCLNLLWKLTGNLLLPFLTRSAQFDHWSVNVVLHWDVKALIHQFALVYVSLILQILRKRWVFFLHLALNEDNAVTIAQDLIAWLRAIWLQGLITLSQNGRITVRLFVQGLFLACSRLFLAEYFFSKTAQRVAINRLVFRKIAWC